MKACAPPNTLYVQAFAAAFANTDVFALDSGADHEDARALVLFCNEMHIVETIRRREHGTRKPVVSSKQAMSLQAILLAGMGDAINGFGQRLERKRL